MHSQRISPLLAYFFVSWLCLLTACQPVYDEEEETSSGTSQPLKVSARASGTSNILYPAYVYAFKGNGDYAARQTLTGPDTPIELKLEPASYTLVAVAGFNDDYILPEKPKLTDVIPMKESNRSNRALMMGRASVDVKSGNKAKNAVTITLYYVVSLVNVTLEGIPNDVKKVSLRLSPLYSSLAFNGEYGPNGQTAEIACTPESDGVWGTEPFYIYPGSAAQTVFTVILENPEGTHTYGYTFNGRPQANVPFNIGGCYQGDVTLGGTLALSDWEQPVDVRFEFGQTENQTSHPNNPEKPANPITSDPNGLPAIGTIWQEGIVVQHLPSTGSESAQILLLSLKESYTYTSNLNETIQAETTAGWRLPNAEEAHLLHKTFVGEMVNAVNRRIAAHDASLPLLDTAKRYLYDNNGSLFAFGFKSSAKFLSAGKKVKYKVRLVRATPYTAT